MRKKFRRFLASPYFNPQPRYVSLFEVLDQHLLRYKLRNLSEQEAWGLYFPELPYDQNKFRKECTALLQLLTDFLAQEAYSDDAPQQSLYLLQQLNALGERHYFPGYAEQANELLAEHPLRFGKVVDIGIEQYKHDLSKSGRTSGVKIGDWVTATELDYVARKMFLMYIELNHLLVTGKGKQREDEAFMQLASQHLPQLPAPTQMYYHLYRCTRDQGAEEVIGRFACSCKPQH
ncbi:MAG: hypothetical protein U0176_24410 [Bacteroidia bacterium]